MRKLYLIGEKHLTENRKFENEFIKFLVKKHKSKPVVMLEGLPFGKYKEGKSNIDVYLFKNLKFSEVWGIDSSFFLQVANAYQDMVTTMKLLRHLYLRAVNEKDEKKKLAMFLKFLLLVKFEKLKTSSNSIVTSPVYNLIIAVQNGNLNLKPERMKPFKKFVDVLNSSKIDEILDYLNQLGVQAEVKEIQLLSRLILRIKISDVPPNFDRTLVERTVIDILNQLAFIASELKRTEKKISFNQFMVERVTRDFRNRTFVKNIRRVLNTTTSDLYISIMGSRHVPFVYSKLKEWSSSNDLVLKQVYIL